jgi:hypothetical protein
MKTVVSTLALCLYVAMAFQPGGATAQTAQTAIAAIDPAEDERLRKVLFAVAAQPLVAAAFVERRTSALFASPLESRGTLTFKPSGVIEKLTTQPTRESMTITADTITLEGAGGTAPQVIKIDAQGPLANYVLGLRAILSGDEKLLRQVFDARMTGSFDAWKIQLRPLRREGAPPPRRGIKQIVIAGGGAMLRSIETTEINGDVQALTMATR